MPELENEYLRLAVAGNGQLDSIEDVAAHERYVASHDVFAVETDFGRFDNTRMSVLGAAVSSASITVNLEAAGVFTAVLEYKLKPGCRYFTRAAKLVVLKPKMTLARIVLGQTRFVAPPRECLRYDTFWNAPTACFLRWQRGGLFCGIENPFFQASFLPDGIELSYEPSLYLEKGTEIETEPQFMGIYRNTGRLVSNQLPKTSNNANGRYHPRFRNPMGHIPLDLAEIDAMKAFAADYLDLRVQEFYFILYCFWLPMRQLPRSDSEAAEYYRIIDNFKELGGDLVLFAPLVKHAVPTSDPSSFWELAPSGSTAEKILDYTRSKGIRYGIYMGSAGQNLAYCNSSMTPYALDDRRQWKKIGFDGRRGTENCIACDEYAEWFFQVQKNTIDKYQLAIWDWDPGPGNGFFCYSNRHGHIPGKGAYKGWRNSTELIRRLKDTFSKLYLQGFYGRKEYGLWGFRYFDQHESYWEQFVKDQASIHPDLHPDRQNASGIRLQNYWNESFRFLPAVINHSLTHRMLQLNDSDPHLKEAWDHQGWQYAVMSSLATGGSLTAGILPANLDQVRCGDIRAFYRKWLSWARRTFPYVRYNKPFGEQVRTGGIDGYARIAGRHGFIFLCNPAPRAARTSFRLDDEVGLEEKGTYLLKELYPHGERFFFDETRGTGLFQQGDSVTIVVPAYQVVLLELLEQANDKSPVLFQLQGSIAIDGQTVVISEATAEEGATESFRVLLSAGTSPKKCTVNGVPVAFSKQDGYLVSHVRFAGELLPRQLDCWRDASGASFSFPFHPPYQDLTLSHSLQAHVKIRQLLEAARLPNQEQLESHVERWTTEGLEDTFIWTLPDRLVLVIPFADADRVDQVSLAVNGRAVPVIQVSCKSRRRNAKIIYYADITQALTWGQDNMLSLRMQGLSADQFLGPYIEYPPSPTTSRVSVGSAEPQAPGVVYERPVVQDLPVDPDFRIAGKTPKILAAWMSPSSIGENEIIEILAVSNLSEEEAEGVYLSSIVMPGFGADEALKYDRVRDLWSIQVLTATRPELILDCKDFYVWTVAKNGAVSEAAKIPVTWRLT